MINSFYNSHDHNCAINIYNHLKSIPNDLYTIITGHCTGLSFIPFLAAKRKNRYALAKTSIILDYQNTPSHVSVDDYDLNTYYKYFEKDLIYDETTIDIRTLKEVFIDGEYHRINPELFQEMKIATIIHNFSELPISIPKHYTLKSKEQN